MSTFPNALTSKKATNHEIGKSFFDKYDRSFMSRTAITLKFKMLWFRNEARYGAVKLQTDIKISSLMPHEDKNYDGS